MKRDIEFKSKGEVCRGWLYTPDSGGDEGSVTVTKEIVMPHYANFFIKAGLAALLFDYRCFGESDGEPRQHIDPRGQIEDYKNAISFAQTLPEVDPNRVGIWGISYSGGHVLIAGATDPRVKCIVSTIPVVDGFETQKQVHGSVQFRRLMEAIMEDRKNRFEDESKCGYIDMAAPDPDKTLCTWPFIETYEAFMDIKKKEAPNHEHRRTIESTELLLSYSVFPYLGRILNIPTLMLVAEGDDITTWDLEIKAYNEIATAQKKLFIIQDTTHMKLYSNLLKLKSQQMRRQIGWLTT